MSETYQVVQMAPGKSGNTKRISASKRWCFTLNNYTEEELAQLTLLGMAPNKYIIGREVGESGTPHLQGYFHFKKKVRPLEIKNISKKIHWEKCKGSEEDNFHYCSKGNDYFTNINCERELDILRPEQLYKWQKEIVDIVKKIPDKRTIHWYWEPNGKCGKSEFAKFLGYYYDAVLVEGKKNDILYNAANHNSNIYLFDFERSMEEYISYGAMEKIKNGFYMSGKYESVSIIRNSPHIIVFANFEPDKSKLSQDRWHIVEIKPPIIPTKIILAFDKCDCSGSNVPDDYSDGDHSD